MKTQSRFNEIVSAVGLLAISVAYYAYSFSTIIAQFA